MIGVDTNVLARLIVADDQAQLEAAKRFFAVRSPDNPAFISLVVIAELVWILDYSYGFRASRIVETMERLLASDDFAIEEPDYLRDAVALAKVKRIDIADYLISQIALRHGCSVTVTFDSTAGKRIPGMELLK